jgi:hypothetical protein
MTRSAGNAKDMPKFAQPKLPVVMNEHNKLVITTFIFLLLALWVIQRCCISYKAM